MSFRDADSVGRYCNLESCIRIFNHVLGSVSDAFLRAECDRCNDY